MSTPIITNELWIPDGAIKSEERDPSDSNKIAIVGPQKGGKSRLAATANRKPIYFWDFDDRLISVAGIPGVYGKTYKDKSLTQSIAWPEVLKDMGMFEYQKSKGTAMPGTMVFDTITFMAERAMQWAIVNNADMRRELIVNSTTKTYVAKGYDPYKVEWSQITNILDRALELGCDLICCFHERPEEAPDSTQANPKFTGKIAVHPPRMAMLLPHFNEVWRIRPDGQGKYKVQTKPNYEFVGATTLNIGSEEEPDISKMVEKHKASKK